jgi:hypothetical protein
MTRTGGCGCSPQALARLIREDHARRGKIIEAAGIKGD